jgi:hypothetical protein
MTNTTYHSLLPRPSLALALVALWLIGATAWAQSAPPAPGKAPKSLDEQLLDDLNQPDPLAPAVPGNNQPAPNDPAGAQPQNSAQPKPLPGQVGEGEDIQLGDNQPHPLTRISEQMRSAQSLITQNDTSTRTQGLQQQILSDLEKLLEQTRKQCQACQNPTGGAPQPGTSAGNKPAQDAGNKPPRDSTQRLGKPADPTAGQQLSMDDVMKEVWGHLPDKLRGRMQTVAAEQFLPQYQTLIEAYYKRLAEESARP